MNAKDVTQQDVVVIGAGAAGLICAIEAGKRQRAVTVLEHNDRVGKKIRISGGGRCNFTNINAGADNFLSQNPHFAKSALARYRPPDFCELVRKHQIPFHEKKLGQLFCDKTAQDVIDLLVQECTDSNARILTGVDIKSISRADDFTIQTSQGTFLAQSVVIATGGLSIPALGATDFGYQIARQFGIKVNPCAPGLVPLTFASRDLEIFGELSGVSVDALVSFGSTKFRENILFTHKGLSGPAVLQISSYWQPGKPVTINLLPDIDLAALLKKKQNQKLTLKNLLKEYLPIRLTEVLSRHFFTNKPLNQYTAAQLKQIALSLHQWKITPAGTEGFEKAEVTVGGVDTDELSSKTMEAKKVPGLYFIGEVVDVTGHLGGFNFQWAWASGFAAGQYA